MCLTAVISQGGVTYVLSDNASALLKKEVLYANSAEEVLKCVVGVYDVGSKVVLLEDGAALAWMTYWGSTPIGSVQAHVEARGYVSDPKAYESIPYLKGFLARPNPGRRVDVWDYCENGMEKKKLFPVENVTVCIHCAGFFEDLVTSEMKRGLNGQPSLDQITAVEMKDLLGSVLEAINKRCVVIGPTVHLARIDENGTRMI